MRPSLLRLTPVLALLACGGSDSAPLTPTPPAGLDAGKPVPVSARMVWTRKELATIEEKVSSGAWRSEEVLPSPDGFEAVEGTQLAAHCDGTELRTLQVGFHSTLGRVENEIYFSEGTPFYARKLDIGYDSPGGGIHRRDEHRYYYDGGRVVRVVRPDGKTLNRPTGQAAEGAREMREMVQDLLTRVQPCAPPPPVLPPPEEGE